ncbi:MAG TPA: hypothetical protein VF316_03275 [Polyangiaceae bacterium]
MRAAALALAAVALCGCSRDTPGSRPSSSSTTAESVGPEPTAPPPAAPTAAVVREEKEVDVEGVKETWRLEWKAAPVPTCIDDSFYTCPCAGFAYGEKGDLDLVRARLGEPEERLRLNALFLESDAVIPRWAPSDAERKSLVAAKLADLASRPLVTVMKLGDYDHDGRATEFVLQVGAIPCGHQQTVVVGIDKKNPHLHALGTAEKPGAPVVFEHVADWEKVRGKLPVTLVETPCGDHGADEDTRVTVSADAQGLHVATSATKCP